MKIKRPGHVVTRRQLLTYLGLGALCCTKYDPLSMLTRSMVDGLIAEAQAQSGIAQPKNFISILCPGAPTRWVWDGFLNLKNESIVRNASVNNWLVEDSYIDADATTGLFPANAIYKVEAVNLSDGRTVYLPPLWNRNIPTSNGGVVKMNTLLDNTLIMRGVNMQVDLGHTKGPSKVLFPLGADASLNGLVGDVSDRPLPVVGTSGGNNYADPLLGGYRSQKGITPTLIPSSADPLGDSISPFIYEDAATKSQLTKLRSNSVAQALKNAEDQLGQYANSSLPGADTLYKNSANATKLLNTAFGDLKGDIYPKLLAKYQKLVERCARTAIPNILPATGNGKYLLATGKYSSSLPYQFAVAEYLITNGLSSTISISASGNAGVAGIFAYNDEHKEPNRQQSLICQSYQFLVLSALIYELRSVLIAKGIWNQTLIHVSSEYNRSPRDDGTGSDHSTSSNVMTMMSGAITKPIFIGNIKLSNDPTLITRGTYGVSAPTQTERGLMNITNNIAASTTAAILGIKNPLTQSASVVAVDSSGTVTGSLAEEPKAV